MDTSKAREERLAAALRQNLRRRKAQSASRDAGSGNADESGDKASPAAEKPGNADRRDT
ncbi:hypothetical protein RDV64_10505 [Acuticoccus sp. MNP-M23]|uniref:hypothetical protein n=1 Tax=Acuticoccus sp. MNP-M23 TaxID=3072793 RepID=UPI0028157664|nr:hypothetical protein [Acuticoccus sp. MNP-M23]WMS44778.1 hypothetical protein RDV64_10505 [Acuticoccus sp. MNP-M23]